MRRINFHRDSAISAISIIGSFASVSSVVVAPLILRHDIPVGGKVALIVLAVLLTAFAVIWVLKPDTTTHAYRVSDQAGINRYLYRWIDSGGRIAIWTRDMSWAEGAKMAELLRRKAERRELIICLPRDIPKSDELKRIGAEVFAYGPSQATDSRFTIVNYGQAGSRVAVGRRSDNRHVIQEYAAADEHPAFYMAYDLIRMVQEMPDADL